MAHVDDWYIEPEVVNRFALFIPSRAEIERYGKPRDVNTEAIAVPGSTRDTDPLHVALQEHSARCDECRTELTRGQPKGFGQVSGMCQEYQKIINMFADGEIL